MREWQQMPNIANTVGKNLAKSVICICGPTAVGKTGVAIKLAQKLETEVLSFDSRQFYREIPIGTAAPSLAEQAAVPHHFIGDRSIQEEFNAGAFAREALQRIKTLHLVHDTLILVGGSGLYLKALLEGFDEMPAIKAGVRSKLEEEFREQGIETLQEELERTDADYYKEVDHQNPQRLMRALEVIRSSGQAYSNFRKSEKRHLDFKVRKIGLTMDREKLYDRINRRVDLMTGSGLLAEAEALLEFKSLNALQTVGFKELWPYFAGDSDLNFALDEIRKNSRRYAKRQLTWFKRETDMEWFQAEDWEKI